MLDWLVRLWHRFKAWILQRPPVTTQHAPVQEPYHPSNLHSRHYR